MQPVQKAPVPHQAAGVAMAQVPRQNQDNSLGRSGGGFNMLPVPRVSSKPGVPDNAIENFLSHLM
jgi:hypothetical protein